MCRRAKFLIRMKSERERLAKLWACMQCGGGGEWGGGGTSCTPSEDFEKLDH